MKRVYYTSATNTLHLHIFSSVIGVCLWAEEQFSEGFKGNIARVQNFTSNISYYSSDSSGSGTSTADTLDLLSYFDNSRLQKYNTL